MRYEEMMKFWNRAKKGGRKSFRLEELDPEFEAYIKGFANDSLPRLYELIEKYGTEKQVITFKSRKEADDFLNKI